MQLLGQCAVVTGGGTGVSLIVDHATGRFSNTGTITGTVTDPAGAVIAK